MNSAEQTPKDELNAEVRTYIDAVRRDLTDDSAWEALVAFAAQKQTQSEVALALRQLLSDPCPREQASSLADRVVSFHDEWFEEKSPELESALLATLEIDPASRDAVFQRLAVVYTVSERWPDLLGLYDREILATGDVARRVALLDEAAQAAKDFAGDSDRAAQYMTELLVHRPHDRVLAANLERLLEKQERWGELASLWEGRLDADSDESVPTRIKIADLRFRKLNDAKAAVALLTPIAEQKGAAPALHLLREVAEANGADLAIRREAAGVLCRAYEAAHDESSHVDALALSIELEAFADREPLLVEAADRCLALGRDSEALGHLGELLALKPSAETLDRVRAVAVRANERVRLVSIFRKTATAGEEASRVSYRVLAAQELIAAGEQAAACGELDAVLASKSATAEIRLDASRLLAEHLPERDHRRRAALDVLVALEGDSHGRRQGRLAAARLAHAEGDLDAAVAFWRACLAENPADEEATEALLSALEAAGRFSDLARALRARESVSTSPSQKRADLVRLAKIQSEKLGNDADAVAIWNEIAAIYGEDAGVVDELVRLYERTERYPDLLELIERARSRESRHLVELLVTEARVRQATSGDAVGALRAYEKILEVEPTNASARTEVRALAEDPALAAEAKAVLATSFEVAGDEEAALELLNDRLPAYSEDKQKRTLARAAQLFEGLSRPADAYSAAGRAFILDPADVALEGEVDRLHRQAGADLQSRIAIRLQAAERVQGIRKAQLLQQAASDSEEMGRHRESVAALAAALQATPLDAALGELLAQTAIAERGSVGLAGLEEAASALESALTDVSAPATHWRSLLAVHEEIGGEALRKTLLRVTRVFAGDVSYAERLLEVSLEQGRTAPEIQGLRRALFDRSVAAWRAAVATGSPNGPEFRQKAEDSASILETEWSEAGEPHRAIELYEALALVAESAQDLTLGTRFRALAADAAAVSGRIESAIDAYRGMARVEPAAPVLERLGDLLRQAEHWGELLFVRKHELGLATEPARRVALRLEIDQLVDVIDRESGRENALRANLEELPGHPQSLARMEALLRARGDLPALAQLLSEQAGRLSGVDSARLWERVAQLSEGDLRDLGRAALSYEKVLEAMPDHASSLQALARLAQERGDLVALARFEERLLSFTQDATERSLLAQRVSETLIRLGRRAKAAAILRKASADLPRDTALRAKYLEHLRQDGEASALADGLVDAARHETADARLALIREAAMLYRGQAQRPEAAVQCLREASELAPEDASLRLELADGLREAGERDEAKAIYVAAVEAFGRRRSPERAQVHVKLASVFDQEGDREEAINQLELATSMSSTDSQALLLLARLTRETGKFDRAEKAYRALLMVVRRKPEAFVGPAEVLFELHELAQARDDRSAAEELLESAMEAAVVLDSDTKRFADALTSKARPEVALQAIERRVASAQGLIDIHLLLARARAKDAAHVEAGAAFQDVLSHPQLDLQVVDELRALAQGSTHAAVFARSIETAIDNGPANAELTAALHLAAGDIAAKQGDLPNATIHFREAANAERYATSAWRKFARAAKGNPTTECEALLALRARPDVVGDERSALLYRLLELLEPSAPERLSVIGEAASEAPRYEVLAAACESALQYHAGDSGVLQVFSSLARDSGNRYLQLRYLEVAADLASANYDDEMNAATAAIDCAEYAKAERWLSKALERAEDETDGKPRVRATLSKMAEVRRLQGDGVGALDWMHRALDATDDADERRRLELELAELAAAPGGDLRMAESLYAGLREVDPWDRRLWEGHLAVCIRLSDPDKLADVSSALLSGLVEPSERSTVRMSIARSMIADPVREFAAVDLLKEVLLDEPGHAEAAQELEKLFVKSGYSEELVDLLTQQLEAAKESRTLDKVTELSIKLGEILIKVRREDAHVVFGNALELVPNDEVLARAFVDSLAHDADLVDRLEAKEKLLAALHGDDASTLARELVAAWKEQDQPDVALRVLALATRRNPTDDSLRNELEGIYRSAARHADLADLLVDRAERIYSSSPAESYRLQREAARIYLSELGDAEKASKLFQEAYLGDRDPAGLDELVVALAAAGDLTTAIEIVSSAIDESSGSVKALLLRRRAALNQEVGQLPEATVDFEAAYALEPAFGDELAAVLLAYQRWLSGDPVELRRVTFRRAEVLVALSRIDGAATALTDFCDRNPEDVEALRKLRALEHARGSMSRVVEVSEQLVAVLTGAEQVEAARALLEAATELGDVSLARAGLERVFEAQPESVEIRQKLLQLYESLGANREHAALLVHEAQLAEDPQRRFEFYREAGRVLVEKLGDGEAALPVLRLAVEAKPADHETLLLLADSYLAAEYYAEAGELLEFAIDNHPRKRSPELCEYQMRMAKLAKAADDRNLEMQWLNAAHESDKNNIHAAADLAWLSYDLGEFDIALNALRAVTLSKNEGSMSRAMAFLLQAKIALQRGEARRALLWARKAKQEDPTLQDATDFLAELGDVG